MRTATQSLSDEEVELIAAEVGREVTVKHAADDEEPEIVEDRRGGLERAAAGGHRHGPRRPRQDDAARHDPPDQRRRRPRPVASPSTSAPTRSSIDGQEDHLPRYPGPRGVHRDARPRRQGDGHRRPRGRGRRRRDAADEGSDQPRRAAEVPIIVAINKIDKPNANPTRVKGSLRRRAPARDMGRRRRSSSRPVSAHGRGIRDLLEKIAAGRRSRARPSGEQSAEASGPIIESLPGRRSRPGGYDAGPAGTLRSAIRSSPATRPRQGARPHETAANASRRRGRGAGRDPRPLPSAGRRRALPCGRARAPGEGSRRRSAQSGSAREQLAQRSTVTGLPRSRRSSSRCRRGAVQELNIVLKGDVQGSVEALGRASSGRSSTPRCASTWIHTGVGGITENDVNLALGVERARDRLQRPAERRGEAARRARGRRHPHVSRDLQASPRTSSRPSSGCSRRSRPRRSLGEAEVRALFKVSLLGTIAACMVTNGVVRRGSAGPRRARRHGGQRRPSIAQLKRFKEDTREVARGLRVRDPARRLQRREGRRHPRGLRDPGGRAHRARAERRRGGIGARVSRRRG